MAACRRRAGDRVRASIVIGAGSLSFEIVRELVERLPLMVTPRWVGVTTKPIAIGDLLLYLREALDIPLALLPCEWVVLAFFTELEADK